ncbi:PhzF family phenazine biosynthesis protein [Paraburkholderia caballeronis]|uniref:Phenazine biosynthesis protein PhzF family n=1 Tax=Paraburkholderia caballeronis TaxID=416943 RepID=A0A1H7T3K6_9BURK|nr:PhzF family phenazine biosynthesis protein [Paraburkholderia caballeronis]PXW22749.1 PhzF family phenazine biosynthesis protein [Paraburkholderia caballeronis]PXW96852.1 PhzF family phenazine biosynthesis protein [Paraburkholderia caballeronis]RAJ93479.1 PhzF family phenazine biosynthesis protein [Paraburkholderia caballeronis]TDV12202.1 PhzF family phenazine biosynthesis protein [Paraburkholderia caballeronis]TDV15277.1 PhzF family phenazine biosynthesis protein [Paraburkholderia caballero
MTARTVRFKQVDVFTPVPFKGNALAVVFDADALDDAQMQSIARWTNLSETTFVVAPTDPAADYRVRIFTTGGELPFAGHPTLGTAHALLDSGYRPKTPGRLVQQCGVGLVELAEQRDGGWAFSAPPARVAPLPPSQYDALAAALRTDAIDFSAAPTAVNNGAPWLVVRMQSAAACLALAPDTQALASIVHAAGAHGVAAYGPHPAGGPATFEVRCLMVGDSFGVGEDPVTGSANAAIAGLLTQQQRRPGPRYTARQGTAIGRDGRIRVEYDDDAGKTWIGGESVTVFDGTCRLP